MSEPADSPLRAEIIKIGATVMETQVAQVERIRVLEEALRPFAEMAKAVERNIPATDDRWALIRVRDTAITYADLKRATQALP